MLVPYIPLNIALFTAVIGGLFMALSFRRTGRSPKVGAVIGAIGGGIGGQLFMLPLNYCTFEAERKPLDVVIGLVLVATGAAVVLLTLRWLLVVLPSNRTDGSHGQSGLFRGSITPWLLLLPTLIILVLFLYYPFLDTFRLSTQLARVGAPRTVFRCVDNFSSLLNETRYINSVAVTFVIAAATVILGLLLALLIASVAYQPIKGANIYRTLLIWPYALSPAVAGIIFYMIFNQTAGIANALVESLFGGNGLQWLSTPGLAILVVVLASVWKTTGFNILFYIAGLQNVPNDLREAAAIDGANVIQRFWRITVPMVSPITFFLIITNTTYAFFDIFGTIDTLTTGGPAGATTVMIYRIYEQGVTEGNIGIAAAQSVILFILVIGLTLLQFRTTGRRVNYGA
ncbi:MAG: hypothetical protein OHK0023_22000 [Anaerolineae bacterium]